MSMRGSFFWWYCQVTFMDTNYNRNNFKWKSIIQRYFHKIPDKILNVTECGISVYDCIKFKTNRHYFINIFSYGIQNLNLALKILKYSLHLFAKKSSKFQWQLISKISRTLIHWIKTNDTPLWTTINRNQTTFDLQEKTRIEKMVIIN